MAAAVFGWGEPSRRAAARQGCLAPPDAAQEADVLRHKLAFARDVKAIPAAIRVDAAFSKFVDIAEEEMAVAEEACKFGRFDAAAESLNRVEPALDELRKARFAR